MRESSEKPLDFIGESKSTKTLILDDSGLRYYMSGYTLYFMLMVLLMFFQMRSKK
jgi:hypothetical protein